MGRSILSIFAGYFLILIWVMTSHSIAWWIGGPELAYKAGTRIETLPWLTISLVLWTIGGVLGGFASALIGKHPRNLPSWVLAVFVFFMSVYSGVMYLRQGAPELPEGIEAGSLDAAQFGIKPEWYPFAMAVLLAAGVLAGSWFYGTDTEYERRVRPPQEP